MFLCLREYAVLPAAYLLLISLNTVAIAQPADTEKDKSPSEKAEQLFEDGRKALYQGKFDDAIQLLKQAVVADTSMANTSYRLHLARAYRYAGKAKEAEEELVVITQAALDHVEAGQLLAEIYAEQKQWKKLVDLLEPLLKYRHDYTTYHLLADAYYDLDDHHRARKYYTEAVKQNAQSAADHYQLGNIHLAENRFALAASSYEAASRLGVKTPLLHYKLASAYFNMRNYFGQVAIISVKSGKPDTINGKYYLIEQVPGKPDVFRSAPPASAVYQLAQAIEGGLPVTTDIRLLKANVYLNAHRYAAAHAMFSEMEGDVPDDDKALYHYYFAQSAFGLGQYDDYLEHLQTAIRLDPESYDSALIDAYLRIAAQHNQAGHLDQYIEYLERAIQESPQTVSLHLKLGDALEEARHYHNAIAQWRMVLDLEPDHPQRTLLVNRIKKNLNRSTATDQPAADEMDKIQDDAPARK